MVRSRSPRLATCACWFTEGGLALTRLPSPRRGRYSRCGFRTTVLSIESCMREETLQPGQATKKRAETYVSALIYSFTACYVVRAAQAPGRGSPMLALYELVLQVWPVGRLG